MTRKLSDTERALWARVAATVEPIRKLHARQEEADPRPRLQAEGEKVARISTPASGKGSETYRTAGEISRSGVGRTGAVVERRSPARPLDQHGLDASWDRRLAKGLVAPDFTLDLHGCTLEQAHARLDHGLTLAASQGARLVLLVTGRARPSDDHGREDYGTRSDRRGAIRAKFLDWLHAGPHASRIAAVRPAQPRHGGAGAVYLVLKRVR